MPSVYATHTLGAFTATATLTDVISTYKIPGQVVTFVYETPTPVVAASSTSALGVSTAAYEAGALAGTYNYSATLSSGPTYGGVSSTATVTVVLRPSTMTLTAAATAYASSSFTATAIVTDFLTGGTGVPTGDTGWYG